VHWLWYLCQGECFFLFSFAVVMAGYLHLPSFVVNGLEIVLLTQTYFAFCFLSEMPL
jgi:hypothetical protein